jgi:hypothetical protein
MKDGEVFTQPKVVASLFNDYFTDIAKHIGSDDSLNYDDNVMTCLLTHEKHDSVINIKNFTNSRETNNEFTFHSVSYENIKLYLNKMKTNKATGWDLLPSRLLKIGSNVLCNSICDMINMSFTTCSFPNSLKCAEISPILKKGNALEISNYRPVSVLPNISKIFEQEMVSQLSVYFEDIFHQYVSGFRKRHSCETILLRMVENIKKDLDDGKVVCLLLMDLSRAFDSIPYKLLISKLHAYGLSISACQLMLNYYSGRKQRVKLGCNNVSDWRSIYKGSAQGSIIGPLSYNMFSNDIFMILDDDVDMFGYADDKSLKSSGYDLKEAEKNLLHNVNNIVSWFKQNNMKVNPDKFNYIVFGNKTDAGSITIDNHVIKPVNHVKLLGLHLDNKLNFDVHISKLCEKAGRQVQVLSRLSHTLNNINKMLLYNCFIECYFNYCSCIWHFCSIANTLKIEKLQKKALRFITLDFHSTYAELLEKSDKVPLYIIRIRKALEMVFKMKNNMCPEYLNNLIACKDNDYNLRADNLLVIPKFKTVTYGKKSFYYMAPFTWNENNNYIKECVSLVSFKDMLHAFIPVCQCGFCIQCKILNM